jgi:hypothetical protein
MHFEDTVWADVVRGTIDQATKAKVDQHLDTGCAECTQALSIWQLMASSSTTERSFTPPADVVRMVKQEFSIQYPKEEKTTLIGKLVFDSFANAAPVGIRSAAAAPRQFLYEANGITVDLRFELQPPHNAFVVGQVLENRNSYSLPIPLLLFNHEGAVVQETETTEFGEFQFEYDTRERLRLSLELTAKQRLQISLVDLQLLRK